MVVVEMKPVTWEPKNGKCFFTEYWEAEFKDHQLNGLEATCRKLWEKSQPWENLLVISVLKKLRFSCTAVEFDINSLETQEAVLGIAQMIKEIWEWALKESPQKVLVKAK